jgi:hypothetical protein
LPDDAGVGAPARRREWKVAQRAVDSEIPRRDEPVVAEGPGGFKFSDGTTSIWVEAWVAVTADRIVWAMPKSPRAGVATIQFDQVVKYLHLPNGIIGLTAQDPNHAATLSDRSDPLGEMDAVFRFDGVPNEFSLRGAFDEGVEQRGRADRGSAADYLF